MEHLVGEGLLLLGDGKAEETEGDDLSGECFGGGDADFGAYVQVCAAVGGTGDGGSDDVADAIEESSLLLGQLDGRKGVGGFARLRDGDDDVVGMDDGVPVAEFGSVLHLNGYLAGLFDEVFADEGGMPGGAAGTDDDTAAVDELVAVVDDAAEENIFLGFVDTSADAGAQGVGLFPNLLEHEVGVAALFQLVEVHLQGDQLRSLLHVAEVGDVEQARAVHDGDFLVVEVDDLVGVFDDGSRIGADVEFRTAGGLVLAYTDDEGTAFAGADNLVGMALLENGDGVCAHDVLKRELDGIVEVAFVGDHHEFD